MPESRGCPTSLTVSPVPAHNTQSPPLTAFLSVLTLPPSQISDYQSPANEVTLCTPHLYVAVRKYWCFKHAILCIEYLLSSVQFIESSSNNTNVHSGSESCRKLSNNTRVWQTRICKCVVLLWQTAFTCVLMLCLTRSLGAIDTKVVFY